MDDYKKCPKCQSRMETGFVPDFSYGAVLLSKWCRGLPQPKKLFGFIQKYTIQADYRSGFPMTAFRCPKCTLVEFYAPESNQGGTS